MSVLQVMMEDMGIYDSLDSDPVISLTILPFEKKIHKKSLTTQHKLEHLTTLNSQSSRVVLAHKP